MLLDEVRGFFWVEMKEWHVTVRRMLRSGLAELTEPNACLLSGARRGMLRGANRPEGVEIDWRSPSPKQLGDVVRKPRLPDASRLRRLRLRTHEVIEVHPKDQGYCIYAFQVSAERAHMQVIGPRALASWARDIDNVGLDVDLGESSWWKADMATTPWHREVPGLCGR